MRFVGAANGVSVFGLEGLDGNLLLRAFALGGGDGDIVGRRRENDAGGHGSGELFLGHAVTLALKSSAWVAGS